MGQTNFLGPLYHSIFSINDTFTFFLSHQKKMSGSANWFEQGLFKKPLNTNNVAICIFKAVINLFKGTYIKLIAHSLIDASFRRTLALIKKILVEIYDYHRKSEYGGDVYHVHYITLLNVIKFPLIHRSKKLVLSFWGSDLLRKDDLLGFIFIKSALERADVITVQSLDLREVLLSKYGRDLYPKIVINQFVLDRQIFEKLDVHMGGRSRYGEKINVLVGHNASQFNRHLEIIQELSKLDEKTKSSLHLVFVFGYGIKSANKRQKYKASLEAELHRGKFAYHFIDDFIDQDAMAKLRSNSDIMIHLPVSDALSAAMTESLYAGNIVITGAWLPYGPFRRNGVRYFEIESMDDLSTTFLDAIINKETIVNDLKRNREIIQSHFLSPSIPNNWYNLLKI